MMDAKEEIIMDQGYSQVFWDACASGDFAAVCAEIKKGCDINYQNGDGRTALMRAAKRDYKDIVRVLLDNGADVNQVDNKGKTAIMGAAKKGNPEEADRGWRRRQRERRPRPYGADACVIPGTGALRGSAARCWRRHQCAG